MRLILFITLLGLAGCCTRRDCDETTTITSIGFNNYSRNQIANGIIVRFDAASGWNQPIDTITIASSALTATDGNPDSLHYTFALPAAFTPQNNYRIQLPVQLIEVTTFKYETFECNSCFLKQQDDSRRLSTVKVNNQERAVAGGFLQVFR
ncbi:MAG: hypothetical protein MUC87_16210 [Bacteroidia bacterium]|jgi:hypothetical protein|nr:hypothetical protein [Bacteroidia bacterium]